MRRICASQRISENHCYENDCSLSSLSKPCELLMSGAEGRMHAARRLFVRVHLEKRKYLRFRY